MSLSTALNISARALTVNQYAMDIVSNNIANMNTEGYSKQRINLGTCTNTIQIGESVTRQILANNGVQIDSVTRYNNNFLKDYYRDQLSYQEYLNQNAELASEIDRIMNELNGNGIDSALTDFYDSLNNLNEYPADSTARVDFIEKTKNLISRFALISEELLASSGNAMGDGTLGSMENSLAYSAILDMNGKLQELADVNGMIKRVQTGSLEANNLQDRKDLILNDLAKYYDFTVKEHENGTVSLYMGEMELVSGENLKGTLDMQIPSAFYGDGKVPEDAPKAIISIINTDGSVYKNVNNVITTGKLGSLVQAENVASGQLTASKVIGQLDILVTSIANTFNELQTREGAYCLSSDWTKLEPSLTELFTGGTVITNEDGTTTTVYTAAGIQVNPEIETNPNLVATAYFPTPADVDELAVGNSENVIAMLATRTNKNNEGLSGMTFEEFYTSLVGKIGVQSRTGEETAAAQSDVVNSINNQVLSETSVDLNEELTDLVKFQTAFTAAARVFNTCNNCLDILVNLGG